MSKSLRYNGEIVSVGGHTVRCEILKEGFSGDPEELTFPADSPVVIEWEETEKIDSICASSCTLKIESMTDREFLNELYTVDAGSVLLNVYRDGALYWSGMLDPEQYEEPYSYQKNYDVSATFSDFGYLSRQKYDRTDMVSVKNLVEYLIGKTGVEYGSIIWKTSTLDSLGESGAFTESYIKSQNWYDEEDEPESMHDVLEDVLKVFSLRVKQKAGNIYVYDLNALYQEETTSVEWDGTDAKVSSDKVYNDVEVTWSPYVRSDYGESSIKYKGEGENDEMVWKLPLDHEVSWAPYNGTYTYGKAWWNTASPRILENISGFKLHTSSHGEGATLGGSAKFCHIEPLYCGSKEDGILIYLGRFDINDKAKWDNNKSAQMEGALTAWNGQGNNAITLPRFYVPYMDEVVYLRLVVEAVIDTRLNYSASIAGGTDDNRVYSPSYCNHIYIPYNLKLEADDGNTYYWNNGAAFASDSVKHPINQGSWSTVQGNINETGFSSMLHYCSSSDKPEDGCSQVGSGNNSYMMGKYITEVPEFVQKMGDGEYILHPSHGGWMTLQISDIIDSYKVNGKHDHYIGDVIGWVMIKSVKFSLVDSYGNEIDNDDVVTKATLNESAKEELTIGIKLDASSEYNGSANGLLVTAGGNPITAYQRSNESGTLSELMCNTIYSQYGSRHLVLTGTTTLNSTAAIYSDANTPGKFLMAGESQDLRQDTSEINIVQFSEDTYVPKSID